MNHAAPTQAPGLGFISMLECDSLGWVGGYLVINPLGRPLEFHCTVPVAPSRAEEILYGATFPNYFFGEVLAATLLRRAKAPVALVLTDHGGVLAARPAQKCPIVYIDSAPTRAASDDVSQIALTAHPEYVDDSAVARRILEYLPGSWPLLEPFQRIEQAVREAQRAA
jgi:hypothetical protein